jgi:hypothetical protein
LTQKSALFALLLRRLGMFYFIGSCFRLWVQRDKKLPQCLVLANCRAQSMQTIEDFEEVLEAVTSNATALF